MKQYFLALTMLISGMAVAAENPDTSNTQESDKARPVRNDDWRGGVGIHFVYQRPDGSTVENKHEAGGVGFIGAGPAFGLPDDIQLSAGGQIVWLQTARSEWEDKAAKLRITEEVSQTTFRFLFGMEIGNKRFWIIRPYASALLYVGANIFNFTRTEKRTDIIVIWGDEVEGTKESETKSRFITGFSGNMGFDVEILTGFSLETRGMFLRDFWVPRQLGEGTVPLYRTYWQVTIGVRLTNEFVF
jgi:hypothetical protein